MNNFKNMLICLTVFILFSIACDGGSKVVGSIYDSENKPVENAEVKFEQIEKGEPKTAYECATKTDKDGKFGCSFLHAPREVQLKLTIYKLGYKKYESQFSSKTAAEKMDNGMSLKVVLEPEN